MLVWHMASSYADRSHASIVTFTNCCIHCVTQHTVCCVMQAVLLPWLVHFLGEKNLLLGGLLISCLEQAFLAIITTKWQGFAAIAVGSLAGVSWPAISSIKSTHCRADQQGLVQGALAGIRALATGLGPLAFAQLFAVVTRTSGAFGYHPGIVFWASCGLTGIAACVAATIDLNAGPPGYQPVEEGGELGDSLGGARVSSGRGAGTVRGKVTLATPGVGDDFGASLNLDDAMLDTAGVIGGKRDIEGGETELDQDQDRDQDSRQPLLPRHT